MLDLIVVGAGPVGLATAVYAGRAGLSCAVIEPRTGVIDKACGEGIMPGGLTDLHALGVDPPGRPLAGIRYLNADKQATATFQDGQLGRGVRRTALHAALLRAGEAAGADLVTGRLRDLRQSATRVTVTLAGSGTELTARHVVAADGLHSVTRRILGVQGPVRATARFGLRRHYEMRDWDDHVQVHWGAHAEAYITPVGTDVIGVAVLSRQRVSFEEHLRGFPGLQESLAAAPVLTAVRGAGPLRQRTTHRVRGRVLLAGDAAGYVDALTGEGTMLGIAQARAAVAAIATDDAAGYERAWRAITRRHMLLTSALVGAAGRPMLRSVVVPAAAALPRVFEATVRSIASN